MRSLDSSRAQVARIYDHLLGGAYNFAVDRDAGERLKRHFPLFSQICLANRAFLMHAVRVGAERGVHQLLDLGCGIPGAFPLHEIVQNAHPSARTVYVDHEPLAVAQTRNLLAGNAQAAAVHADLRRPQDVLAAPETRRLLDFAEPVMVVFGAVLHFVLDSDDIDTVLGAYKAVLAPGSLLVVSHLTADDHPAAVAVVAEVGEQAGSPMRMRSKAEIVDLFTGCTLVGRGVDYVSAWCAEVAHPVLAAKPHWSLGYGAIGRQD